MKIFDDFSNNTVQFCDSKTLLYENKETFKFEKELSKNKEKNNIINNNNKNNILKNKNVKNNKSIFSKDEKLTSNLNCSKIYKKDSIKDCNFEDNLTDFKENASILKNNIIEIEEDLDEKILYDISLITNVNKEKINDTIKDLNINIYDLKDNVKLISFLEKIFDVNNVELLSIPEVCNIIKNIDEIFLSEEDLNNYNFNHLKIDKNKKINFDTKEIIENKNTYENKTKLFNDDELELIEKVENIENKNEDIFKYNRERERESNSIIINNNKKELLENINNDSLEELNICRFNIVNENNMNIKEEITHFSSDKKVINIKYDDIINQITNKLNSNFKLEVSELKIKLKPEELGEITLKISTENKIIAAKIIAENQTVKEIIESRFNELRDTLSKQGINISELSVSVDDKNKNNFMKEFLEERLKEKEKNTSNSIIIDNKNIKNHIIKRIENIDVYNNSVDYTA